MSDEPMSLEPLPYMPSTNEGRNLTLRVPGTPNPAAQSSISLKPSGEERADHRLGSVAAYASLSRAKTTAELNEHPPSRAEWLGTILWSIFDVVVLFRMGSIYLHRFEDFEGCDHPLCSDEREQEVTLWRKEQQKEWDRLSTTVKHLFAFVLVL